MSTNASEDVVSIAAAARIARPTWSCTECARRKIKCSKTIPCEGCVKRGEAQCCKRGEDGRQHRQIAAQSTSVTPLDAVVAQLLDRVDRLERLQAESTRRQAGTESTATLPLPAESSPSPSSDSSATPRASSTAVDGDAADNQETSVTIEYLALGKNRRLGILGSARDPHTATAPTTNILDTAHAIAMPRVIAHVWPAARSTTESVMAFHRDAVQWQHACIHTQTFDRQLRAMHSLEPRLQWSHVDTLWLALLFSIQTVALHQLPCAELTSLFPGRTRQAVVDAMLAAALRCLELGNYMQQPSFFTCQAIAVLSVSGHNVVDSNLLASLLAVGIKTAQTLNLHVLGAEARRMEAEHLGRRNTETRRRLVALEMGKRVWWSLVQQDYFAIPFRGVSLVHPRQHDTPFPLNVHDGDLHAGDYRPLQSSTLSVILKQRITSMSADVLCRFFHSLPTTGTTLAQHLEPYERALSKLLPEEGLVMASPPSPSHLRYGPALARYLKISVRHKMLVMHRAFCGRAPKSKAEAAHSQAACVELAREIVGHCQAVTDDGEEAMLAVMWTTAYHAVAAATVLAMDMFAQANTDVDAATDRRAEVEQARASLQRLASRSPIAERGVKLLTSLLAQFEQAMRAESGGAGSGAGGDAHRHKRTRLLADGSEAAQQSDNELALQRQWEMWDHEQVQAIVSMLEAMPDVGRLFDGSLGDPFASMV